MIFNLLNQNFWYDYQLLALVIAIFHGGKSHAHHKSSGGQVPVLLCGYYGDTVSNTNTKAISHNYT